MPYTHFNYVAYQVPTVAIKDGTDLANRDAVKANTIYAFPPIETKQFPMPAQDMNEFDFNSLVSRDIN